CRETYEIQRRQILPVQSDWTLVYGPFRSSTRSWTTPGYPTGTTYEFRVAAKNIGSAPYDYSNVAHLEFKPFPALYGLGGTFTFMTQSEANDMSAHGLKLVGLPYSYENSSGQVAALKSAGMKYIIPISNLVHNGSISSVSALLAQVQNDPDVVGFWVLDDY